MERIDPSHPPRLEFRDLTLMLALASARTTAGAARRLLLTQPAVSRALLGLEGRLGVRLFERSRRGLEPTSAGRTLLADAPRLLDELARLASSAQGSVSPTRRLRLVCECYTAYHWLPSALQGLRAGLPGVELSIVLEFTRDPIGGLEAGEIDAALVSEAPMPRSRRLTEKPLFADEIVFVMAAAHPLAARAALAPADLRGERLLVSRAPTRSMGWFHRPLSVRGEPPPQYDVLPLTEAVIDFARAGMGIGVLSEWVAEPHLRRGDVVARRLGTGPIRRPWRLVWRREVSETAQRLWQVLADAAPRTLALPPIGRRRPPGGQVGTDV
jgi:LysR family transcriptional regulator for metE and metH